MFEGKYKFSFMINTCDQYYSVIIFSMSTGLKLLKVTANYVELHVLHYK
jgi:hypothetical protein